jgi:signal peptidase I
MKFVTLERTVPLRFRSLPGNREAEGVYTTSGGACRMRDRVKAELGEWGKTLLLTALLSLGLRIAVVEAFVVPTPSMVPTIEVGDRLLGSKFHYWLWEPKSGDVVVFRPPEEAQRPGEPRVPRFVKRVIAVGGDIVEVRGGKVFVNGEALHEPYLASRPSYRYGPVVVPEDQIFVLGDNRNGSHDSHVWGFVPQHALIAHVFARFWPLQRIGRV